jgi:hypothetical protein
MAIEALFAVWGALANGNANEARAADVRDRMQQLFNDGVILRRRLTITAAFRTTPVRRARRSTSSIQAVRVQAGLIA